jgi:hypothetical protein
LKNVWHMALIFSIACWKMYMNHKKNSVSHHTTRITCRYNFWKEHKLMRWKI